MNYLGKIKKFAIGGELNPISNNVEMVSGDTHQQDTNMDGMTGVMLQDQQGNPYAEVEDGEAIVDGNKVVSDSIQDENGQSLAKKVEQLALMKETLQQEMETLQMAKAEYDELKSKSSSRYDAGEINRELENIEPKIVMLNEMIGEIDQQIQGIFQQQEQMKQQQMMAQQGMMGQEGMSPEQEMIAQSEQDMMQDYGGQQMMDDPAMMESPFPVQGEDSEQAAMQQQGIPQLAFGGFAKLRQEPKLNFKSNYGNLGNQFYTPTTPNFDYKNQNQNLNLKFNPLSFDNNVDSSMSFGRSSLPKLNLNRFNLDNDKLNFQDSSFQDLYMNATNPSDKNSASKKPLGDYFTQKNMRTAMDIGAHALPLLDAYLASRNVKKTPHISKPVYSSTPMLNTTYDTTGAESNIKSGRNLMMDTIDKSINNSQVAAAMKMAGIDRSTQQLNQLASHKVNYENQMRNEQAKLSAENQRYNNALQMDYLKNKTLRDAGILQDKRKIQANTVDKLLGMYDNQIQRRFQERQLDIESKRPGGYGTLGNILRPNEMLGLYSRGNINETELRTYLDHQVNQGQMTIEERDKMLNRAKREKK